MFFIVGVGYASGLSCGSAVVWPRLLLSTPEWLFGYSSSHLLCHLLVSGQARQRHGTVCSKDLQDGTKVYPILPLRS